MNEEKRRWLFRRFRAVQDSVQRAFDEMTNSEPLAMYLQAQARYGARELASVLSELEKIREEQEGTMREAEAKVYGKKAKPE